MSGKHIRGKFRNGESDRALRRIVAIVAASGTLLLATVGTASATDLFLVLRSPSFGGTNAAPFQYEQFDKTLRDQSISARGCGETAFCGTVPVWPKVFI